MADIKQNKIRHTVECKINPQTFSKKLAEITETIVEGDVIDLDLDYYGSSDRVKFKIVTRMFIDEPENEDKAFDQRVISFEKRNYLRGAVPLAVLRKYIESLIGFDIEGKIEGFSVGYMSSDEICETVSLKIVATKEDRLKELTYDAEVIDN